MASLRINVRKYYGTEKRQHLLKELIEMFCDDYDMYFKDVSLYLTQDAKHLDVLVNFLQRKGFQVNQYMLMGAKDDILSWGLEFDEKCEYMMALKLKHLYD